MSTVLGILKFRSLPFIFPKYERWKGFDSGMKPIVTKGKSAEGSLEVIKSKKSKKVKDVRHAGVLGV